jgi:undecaprenyl phosphate-alpha-L-ara4FN deformylase
MGNKSFALRVDLESDVGIRKGLPQLLDLLKRYNLKASFYLTMGGESNIFDLIRYRKPIKNSGDRTIRLWSFKDKIRMALFPKDFVKRNSSLLKRILNEGHELGLHAWKHRAWTRGLEKIEPLIHLTRAKNRYFKLFGKNPISFASPAFNINEKTLKSLSLLGIKYISDFSSKTIKGYPNIKNVPIIIKGDKNTPIIEYLVSKGMKDEKIIRYIQKRILENDLSSMYMHGLFEARFKLNILEELFKYLRKEKIKNRRIIDY